MMPYFSSVYRPKLLIQAAQIALKSYNRKKGLERLLNGCTAMDSTLILKTLSTQELEYETARINGCASYLAHKHITLLTALLAELKYAKREI